MNLFYNAIELLLTQAILTFPHALIPRFFYFLCIYGFQNVPLTKEGIRNTKKK